MNYICEKHGWGIEITNPKEHLPVRLIIMPCGCEIKMNWMNREITA